MSIYNPDEPGGSIYPDKETAKKDLEGKNPGMTFEDTPGGGFVGRDSKGNRVGNWNDIP